MRLFVAVELPDEIKDRLVALSSGLHGARWVDPAQMHLTLRFVGGVDRPQADDVADALGQVYAPRFDVALAGLGEFSARGRPSVLWAGVRPNLGRYVTSHEPFSAGPFAFDEFVLFSSVLGSEGATHIAEAAYPLHYARDAAAE